MLYGLGPGEILACLVPFFIVLATVFGLLIRADLKSRDAEANDDD